MNRITKLNKWANTHTNIVTDALRIVFGAFIFYKGFFFLNETEYLSEVLGHSDTEGIYFILVHYVALAHLCGGFFIAIGLITRLSALMQLPILLGAVLVNFTGIMNTFNLTEALVSLATCCFFIVYGSGKHSADYSLQLNM